MPATAMKNFAGSPAAQMLGLGDDLSTQLSDMQAELRKKKQLEAGALGQQQGLFSPATLALLGNPNANLING